MVKLALNGSRTSINTPKIRLRKANTSYSLFMDIILTTRSPSSCTHVNTSLSCSVISPTHILQGLDVVIFSPLKKFIGEERNTWLRKHRGTMDKNNFLAIYGRAHVRALTPDNIKAAFKKTGVWPFNPDVVTEEMLTPSRETSCEAHLPLPPDDPAVNVLATMLRKLATINEAVTTSNNYDSYHQSFVQQLVFKSKRSSSSRVRLSEIKFVRSSSSYC